MIKTKKGGEKPTHPAQDHRPREMKQREKNWGGANNGGSEAVEKRQKGVRGRDGEGRSSLQRKKR